MFGLHILDILAIAGYFLLVIGIGWLSKRLIKNETDYFLGGRRFGKLVSIFLSFGTGTSSDTAISASRETYRVGMSGIWIQLLWLFITPFYWIIAPWYRRLRVITGGDYFQQRFQSKGLTALYVWTSIIWLMFYIAIGLTAIGKTIEIVTVKSESVLTVLEKQSVEQYKTLKTLTALENPTVEQKQQLADLKQLEKQQKIKAYYSHISTQQIVPIIALIILIYGLLGGLYAAAWTDTLQGILILVLSVLLLPMGMYKAGWFSGLHATVPADMFKIISTSASSDYTWYYIVALIAMNLVGVAAQPHIFVTGGGSAKDEMTARIGLVFGNYLKRFTTIMWGFTGVVAFALYKNVISDPDMIWGYATDQLLGPGFVGIMIACLLAASMSSADAFMICGSALFTRNFYRPLVSDKSEEHYVKVGRLVSAIMIAGAIAISLYFNDVLSLIKYYWQLPVIFGAVFWVSILWRYVTRTAALVTVFFSWMVIVMLPNILPQMSFVAGHVPAGVADKPMLVVLALMGVGFDGASNPILMTLNYSLNIILPFVLLVVVSLFTSKPERKAVDNVFARLNMPVSSDPNQDVQNVDAEIMAYEQEANPSAWGLKKFSKTDVWGFFACIAISILVILFAWLIANITVP